MGDRFIIIQSLLWAFNLNYRLRVGNKKTVWTIDGFNLKNFLLCIKKFYIINSIMKLKLKNWNLERIFLSVNVSESTLMTLVHIELLNAVTFVYNYILMMILYL